jgi:hypothetical protein
MFSTGSFSETPQEKESKTQTPSQDRENSFSPPENREISVGEVFGMFDLPITDGRDYEEEAFLARMKLRKKKKQQRHI